MQAVDGGSLRCTRAAPLLPAAALLDLQQLQQLLPANCLVLGLYQRRDRATLTIALDSEAEAADSRPEATHAALLHAETKFATFSVGVPSGQPPAASCAPKTGSATVPDTAAVGSHGIAHAPDVACDTGEADVHRATSGDSLQERTLAQWLWDAGVDITSIPVHTAAWRPDSERCRAVRKALARWARHRAPVATCGHRGSEVPASHEDHERLSESHDIDDQGEVHEVRAEKQSMRWAPLRVAEPADACSDLTAQRVHSSAEKLPYSGAAVLVARGGCAFADKAARAAAAGARAVLVVNTEDCGSAPRQSALRGRRDCGGLISMSGHYEGAQANAVPVASVRGAIGRSLMAAVRCSAQQSVTDADHFDGDQASNAEPSGSEAAATSFGMCGAHLCAALHADDGLGGLARTAPEGSAERAAEGEPRRLLADTLLQDHWTPYVEAQVRYTDCACIALHGAGVQRMRPTHVSADSAPSSWLSATGSHDSIASMLALQHETH